MQTSIIAKAQEQTKLKEDLEATLRELDNSQQVLQLKQMQIETAKQTLKLALDTKLSMSRAPSAASTVVVTSQDADSFSKVEIAKLKALLEASHQKNLALTQELLDTQAELGSMQEASTQQPSSLSP